MIRRFDAVPNPNQTYRLRPGAYGILVRDGAALITMQSDPVPEYQLPGGGVDPGESPTTALHREVMEETGWSIAKPRRLGAYRRFVFMPEYNMWAEKLCMIYTARAVRRHGPPSEPGHRAVWCSLDDLPQKLSTSGDRAFAARFT